MIRLLQQHQVDQRKYDHCISMDASGLPYGYSWYLDTLCSWQVLVKNDYEAVWPLPINKKFGLSYYYRPYTIQQLGIFSKKPLSDEDLLSFVHHLCQNIGFADVFLNEGQLPAPVYRAQYASMPNYVLSLSGSYQKIYEGFNNNTKRAIKRSAKEQLQLFEHDGPKVLLDLFKANRGAKLNLKDLFYKQMERAMFTYLHRKMGKVYTVYGAGNQIVAGAFVVMSTKRHVLLFTAISEAGKQQAAMHFLINEHLIFHSEKPLLFDFEGSQDEGVARFYRGFGAQLKEYTRLQYNNLPFPLKYLKR